MLDESEVVILIVDDKKQNLYALEHVLRKVPARVIQAMSGDEALALTLKHDFALVPRYAGSAVAYLKNCRIRFDIQGQPYRAPIRSEFECIRQQIQKDPLEFFHINLRQNRAIDLNPIPYVPLICDHTELRCDNTG